MNGVKGKISVFNLERGLWTGWGISLSWGGVVVIGLLMLCELHGTVYNTTKWDFWWNMMDNYIIFVKWYAIASIAIVAFRIVNWRSLLGGKRDE